MAAQEELKACSDCGATVYPEHLEAGRASYWAGQLLCAVCLNKRKSAPPPEEKPATDEEPLSLVADSELEESGRRVIQAFRSAEHQTVDENKLARPLNKTGAGATRMKLFHTKMSDGATEYLASQINEWLDSDSDIEVKFVDSTVGMWEGKHAEPHLILTVWY